MASLPDYAGIVSYRRARTTGTYVGVYRANVAGIESDPALPWATVCEPHGGCMCYSTRADAMTWAPHPEDWCPTCKGEVTETTTVEATP
jgi:hypothetical protein